MFARHASTVIAIPTESDIDEMLGELPRWETPVFPSEMYLDHQPVRPAARPALTGRVIPASGHPEADTLPGVWTSEIHLPALR
jgi:hypothetical protein